MIPSDAPSISALSADEELRSQEYTLKLIHRGDMDGDGNWIPGPLWWPWHATETFDPHWLDKKLSGPHRPFPRLPYFPWLFYKMMTED